MLPEVCLPSQRLFIILTRDCTAKRSSNLITKFADDTTVASLISNNDESAYREEMEQLADWCRGSSLSLQVDKVKKIVESGGPHSDRSTAHQWQYSERIKVAKILGVHITVDLTWTLNSNMSAKRVQQCLYFLLTLTVTTPGITESFRTCWNMGTSLA